MLSIPPKEEVGEFLEGNDHVYMALRLRARPNVIYTVKAI